MSASWNSSKGDIRHICCGVLSCVNVNCLLVPYLECDIVQVILCRMSRYIVCIVSLIVRQQKHVTQQLSISHFAISSMWFHRSVPMTHCRVMRLPRAAVSATGSIGARPRLTGRWSIRRTIPANGRRSRCCPPSAPRFWDCGKALRCASSCPTAAFTNCMWRA